MANRADDSSREVLKLDFDRRLTLQFRGSVVIADAGLLAYRELGDALGLSVMARETPRIRTPARTAGTPSLECRGSPCSAASLDTSAARPAENVVAFHNDRGACEQWIKVGKGAVKWTRLSCRSFAANAVRVQLHALANNLANLLRTLATPEPTKDWSLTSLKEKRIKIGAWVASHGRYVAFKMAEVAAPRDLSADILRLIAAQRPPPPLLSTA